MELLKKKSFFTLVQQHFVSAVPFKKKLVTNEKSSFQMIAESKYAITIVTLSDWRTNLAPVFQPMRSKPTPIAPSTCDFSRACKLQVIA